MSKNGEEWDDIVLSGEFDFFIEDEDDRAQEVFEELSAAAAARGLYMKWTEERPWIKGDITEVMEFVQENRSEIEELYHVDRNLDRHRANSGGSVP